MKIRTNEGIGEPMPLSDLQENNLIFRKMIKYGVILGYLVLIYVILMTYYIIHYNVINNIVARCV